jgi:transcriptional regulator of heat shock response
MQMEEQIELLKTAYEYLTNLTKGTLEAAVNFQSGQEFKGFQSVSLIANGIMWLIEAIEMTRQVQEEEISIDGIADIVREINEAMQKRDTVSLADLLEFEVSPILQKWQDNIQKLIAN